MNPSEAELYEPVCYGYSSKTAAYCIEAAMSRRSWNAEEMARSIGIPPTYMVSLLRGQEFVGEELLDRVAEVLDYTPGQVLSLMYFHKPSRNFF